MSDMPDRVGDFDAIAQRVVAVANPITECVDVRGFAIVEIVFHVHDARIGCTRGGGLRQLVPHRVVAVLGDNA